MQLGMGLSLTNGGKVNWTPAALGASLLGWWTAGRSDLMTDDGAGLISSWRDVVAGYDATAATSARPTYSATSLNGRPALTFDGAANVLVTATQPFPSGANPVEVWALLSQDALVADTTARSFFSYGGSASFNLQRRFKRTVTTGVNRLQCEAGDGTTSTSAINSTVDFSGVHVVREIVTATTVRAEIDGSAGTALSVVPATGTTRAAIGATASLSNFWNGKIAHILVTEPLSTSQASQLRGWLNAEGGL